MKRYVYSFKGLGGINYVGQTGDINSRWMWNGYHYKKDNQYIYKYCSGLFGADWWHWIDRKVICTCNSKKQSDIIETYYILAHDAVRKGQNRNLGCGLKYIFPQGYDIEWIYDNREDVMEMLAAEAWDCNVIGLTDFNFE